METEALEQCSLQSAAQIINSQVCQSEELPAVRGKYGRDNMTSRLPAGSFSSLRMLVFVTLSPPLSLDAVAEILPDWSGGDCWF